MECVECGTSHAKAVTQGVCGCGGAIVDRVISRSQGARTTYTGPHKQSNDDGRGHALVEVDGEMRIVPLPAKEKRQ